MSYRFSLHACTVITALAVATGATAQEPLAVEMHMISEKGNVRPLGTINVSDTKNGYLRLDLNLKGELRPGGHGFHIHETGDCGPAEVDGTLTAGGAAGGHFDPTNTDKHRGPSGDGHLGDLPILFVEPSEDDGAADSTHSLVAPRLKLADIRGRSIMIHANSDNYEDEPKPLGGGGARVACGVVPK